MARAASSSGQESGVRGRMPRAVARSAVRDSFPLSATELATFATICAQIPDSAATADSARDNVGTELNWFSPFQRSALWSSWVTTVRSSCSKVNPVAATSASARVPALIPARTTPPLRPMTACPPGDPINTRRQIQFVRAGIVGSELERLECIRTCGSTHCVWARFGRGAISIWLA